MRAFLWLALAGPFLALTSHVERSTGAVASVDTVDVSPNLDTLRLREAGTATARVVDSVGRAKNTPASWTSRDTNVVRVRAVKWVAGLSTMQYRARGDTGRTYIVATAGAKKDSIRVIVLNLNCDSTVLASLNLEPDSTTAHRTDTLGFTLSPKSQCGNRIDGINPTFSAGGSGLTVSRLDSLVARAIATDSNGTAYVKAVSGSIRDSVKVKLKHAP